MELLWFFFIPHNLLCFTIACRKPLLVFFGLHYEVSFSSSMDWKFSFLSTSFQSDCADYPLPEVGLVQKIFVLFQWPWIFPEQLTLWLHYIMIIDYRNVNDFFQNWYYCWSNIYSLSRVQAFGTDCTISYFINSNYNVFLNYRCSIFLSKRNMICLIGKVRRLAPYRNR